MRIMFDYLMCEPKYLREGYTKARIGKMIQKLKDINAKLKIAFSDQTNTASNRTTDSSRFVWDNERYALHL